MTSREPHREALRQRFAASFHPAGFSVEELDLITKHGTWMDALVSGKICPITEAQTRFLEVASGRAEPQSIHEKIWLKLSVARATVNSAEKQIGTVDIASVEPSPIKPTAMQIIELARAGKLSLQKLTQVVNRSEEFDFSNEQLSELQIRIQEITRGSSKAWSSCSICHGDGGPGGRCHHCGGNGFEP